MALQAVEVEPCGSRGSLGVGQGMAPGLPQAVGQLAAGGWSEVGFGHPQARTVQLFLHHVLLASTKAMAGGGSGALPFLPQHSAVLCRGRLLPSSSCCEKLKELETIAYKPVISHDKSAVDMSIRSQQDNAKVA